MGVCNRVKICVQYADKEDKMINFEEMILSFDKNTDYTINEVKEIVGLSYGGVMGAIKRGVLPSRKVFSRHYINGGDIIKYLTNKK